MSVTIVGSVAWSDEFVVVDCSRPLREVLKDLDACVLPWLVVSRARHQYLYVLHPDELRRYLPARPTRVQLAAATDRVLQLHETQVSTRANDRAAPPPPIDRTWRPQAEAPSIERYVAVDARGAPQAVGSPVLTARRGAPVVVRSDDALSAAAPPMPASAPPRRASRGMTRSQPPAAAEPAAATAAAPADEGDTPTRHPSIEIDAPFVAGRRVVITVDLAREAVAHTQGGPVAVGTLAADWQTLELTVHLQCAALDLAATQATVTMRRNAASLPARFEGLVRADAAPGMVPLVATFLIGTRWCGGGVRMVPVGDTPAATGAAASASQGVVALDPGAAQPDLTVHIGKLDRRQPGRLRFLCVTPRFDGLPPKLEEDIDLGRDPAAEASALFKEFAVLERGQHRQRIEGFGSRLWALAPPMLRAVYWALWDKHRRELSIQFVSEEPHLPWELMRPARDDESEVHAPLALAHATARWIKRWDGFMRQRVPAGRICTIAPKYASASRALKRAQLESDKLVADFGARKEAGTRGAVFALLEAAAPPEPLAVLHFAGHGVFAADAASHSAIKLEDGDLAAAEVERPEVKLGRACRTLVFFNACEVGAAGAVFGEVGGWADAFLGRQFGGFIAPLWSVDDEDAGVVAAELLQRLCRQHEPVGAALRAVRAAHGETSPTFYSYLYYGDVLARIDA